MQISTDTKQTTSTTGNDSDYVNYKLVVSWPKSDVNH